MEGKKMKRMAVMLVGTLVVGAMLGIIGSRALSAQQQQQPLKRTMLLKADLKGLDGKEGVVALVELAPGAFAGKHYHPGNEVNYILEGSGILEIEGRPPITLQTGTTSHIPDGDVHSVTNTSATGPLKLLAFWVAEKGKPLAVPVK
jgi:quercetin dioxygenase-like cupin family protein